MSSFLKYLLIFFLLLTAPLAFAEDADETFGRIIFELDETEDEPDASLKEQIEAAVEVVHHFDKVLEGENLEQNFTDEIAKVLPGSSTKELYDLEKKIRIIMRLYRYFKNIYDEVIQKLLTPEEPPLILADEEYEMGWEFDYIESPINQAVIVQDFKKVISYSGNPRDINAMTAKRKRDLEAKKEKSRFEQLFSHLSKVNWKKALFSNSDYSPFTGTLGGGVWYSDDNINARVLSETSMVDNRKSLNMALNFTTPSGFFIKASPQDIQINFHNSKNLASYEVFFPFPYQVHINETESWAVYGSNFSIPFKAELEDETKDLSIAADIRVTLCDHTLNCNRVSLHPVLLLEHGEGLDSQHNTYITKLFANIPPSHNPKLEILSVSSTEHPDKVLKIVLKNKYSLSNVDIFIESLNGVEFERPRISIDGKKVVARARLKDQSQDIVGKDLTITAVANYLHSVRDTRTVSDTSIFDTVSESLSIPLILLAILGGLILNFMPCVFPVLSIKILSLNKLGARRQDEVKRSFLITTLGILITFFVLALTLCFIKFLGYSIGWGMQFQNPVFLIIMIFAITFFVAYILGVQNLTTPNWLNKLLFKSRDENSSLYFMTGVLAVVMATPCTAPYLGTVIGFALAGSYIDIITILMAVGVGLSLPYIFFALLPETSVYVPKSGSWMYKVNAFMIAMLILTLLWLLSIYYVQTTFWASIRMGIYALIVLFVLWFRKLLITEIETTIKSKPERIELKRKSNTLCFGIIIMLFATGLWDGIYHFGQKHTEVMQVREDKINFDEIAKHVKAGKAVLVNVQADWCLTCKYNDFAVFSGMQMDSLLDKEKIVVINVDWTNYDKEVLEFMELYGRKGLPFYVVYSPKTPDGLVLPEILNEVDFARIIYNLAE